MISIGAHTFYAPCILDVLWSCRQSGPNGREAPNGMNIACKGTHIWYRDVTPLWRLKLERTNFLAGTSAALEKHAQRT